MQEDRYKKLRVSAEQNALRLLLDIRASIEMILELPMIASQKQRVEIVGKTSTD